MDIVTLLEELVNGLIAAEDKFLQNPKDFYSLEKSVKSTTESFSAAFLGNVLTSINKQIYDDGWRQGKYKVQRTDSRTLISSVGDVNFESTYYRRYSDGTYHYLIEEILGLDPHERFTEEAEVVILTEALKTSYAEAARTLPSKQEISKTTVMNKVHGIAEDIPLLVKNTAKKQCEYLFVEADEDHVAEQHGRWSKAKDNAGFISKLAYVYEYKRESPKCKARKELVETFYFSGIYAGGKKNEQFWDCVSDYIYANYDEDTLKHIYLLGDGGGWIKSGAKQLHKALFCVDKYHMTKYINKAANQMLDEADDAKANIYRMLHKKDQKGLLKYMDSMLASANNQEPIKDLKTFVAGNWSAIMRTYHNKIITGCSAEGHVSHVLSDRLSSRPMAWSETGADRMSKLRCYEKNYGREKIIDLVQYSRERRKLAKTGTDDREEPSIFPHALLFEQYNQSRSYIERMQATIPYGTVRKMAAIREQIKLI